MENVCPKDGTPLQLTHLTYIEECPKCGYCFDAYHDREVEREWVYGDGYPDDDSDDDSEDDYEPTGVGFTEPPYPDQDPAAKLCRYCHKTIDNCICEHVDD